MPKKPQTQVAISNQDRASLLPVPEQDQATLVKQIHQLHENAQKAMASVVISVVELGEKLVHLKKKVPHGSWESFLESNFPTIHKRTLQRYMNFSRFVEDNPARLRSFLVESSPQLKVEDLSDREVLCHITWDAFQNLYKHPGHEDATKTIEATPPVLNSQIARCIAETLGQSIDEAYSDISFSTTELIISSVHSPVPRKAIEVKGSAAIILAQSILPTADCLKNLQASLAPTQTVLLLAPIKYLAERAFAALPHILLHGVSVLPGLKSSADYFIGFIGSNEKALTAFKNSSALLGTFCMPISTVEEVSARSVAIEEH